MEDLINLFWLIVNLEMFLELIDSLIFAGSLIKLVYFSRNIDSSVDLNNSKSHAIEGRLHFAKFETSKINDCLEFISSRKLHMGGIHPFP